MLFRQIECARDRGKLKISGVILFGKNIEEGGLSWGCWKCCIESPYFRTNRGNESSTRDSVRVTFTL